MRNRSLWIVPCDLADANAFIRQHHRHHGPRQFHKFSLAVADAEGAIRGVAIVFRPVSRHLDNGLTLEISRLATDGTMNACSMLLGACRRAAFALGYRRLITYTLNTEPGTSLRAAGWQRVAETREDGWNRPGRPRVDRHPTQRKFRWEAVPS